MTGFRPPRQYNAPTRDPVVDMVSDDYDSDTSSDDSLPRYVPYSGYISRV